MVDCRADDVAELEIVVGETFLPPSSLLERFKDCLAASERKDATEARA
jgi:hypothetical protein